MTAKISAGFYINKTGTKAVGIGFEHRLTKQDKGKRIYIPRNGFFRFNKGIFFFGIAIVILERE